MGLLTRDVMAQTGQLERFSFLVLTGVLAALAMSVGTAVATSCLALFAVFARQRANSGAGYRAADQRPRHLGQDPAGYSLRWVSA